MPEFFVHSTSFAAPFFSDEGTTFVQAATAEAALTKFAADYKHPAGLYAADAYASSDDYHKGKKHLARWLCNKQRVLQDATAGMSGYSVYSPSPDIVEINGELHVIRDPHEGRIVRV